MIAIQDVIRKKRDRQSLTAEDLKSFTHQLREGQISDVQLAAWCMAVFIQDLNLEERFQLTQQLTQAGERLDWQDLNGVVLDKSSSGGVGDMSALLFAPLLAACGAYVPMTVGAALAHTGSSIDKLAAIPGLKRFVALDEFKRIVKNVGCAIVAQAEPSDKHPQTVNLTPLNRRLDEIRVLSSTVTSAALMSCSMLATKWAAGVKHLTVDVKLGNGAFIHSFPRAQALAAAAMELGQRCGLRVGALISDLNQPIGSSIGHGLEVAEAVRFLRGEKVSPRLEEFIFSLAGEALLNARLADSPEQAQQKLKQALHSGRAAERFDHMIIAQGGPDQFCSTYKSQLRRAPVIKVLHSPLEGIIQRMDTRALALAAQQLSGGRGEHFDASAGFSDILPVGAYLQQDTPLVTIHAGSEDAWQRAASEYLAALHIGDTAPVDQAVIHQIQRPQEA